MKYLFVADAFVDQYSGGAELTTQAIMSGCKKKPYSRINASQVTNDLIMKFKDHYWIIGNFASLKDKVKVMICKNVKYSIVEYDYKFCMFRSMDKHQYIKSEPCDCYKKPEAKINKVFYGYAEKIWFMSEEQRDIFLEKIPTMKKEKCEVLSSVFSKGDLRFMDSIKDNPKSDNYLILESESWIKDTAGCIQYAKENNIPYELVKGLSYPEMLIKMSTSKGLIFRPVGGDTCPRIVIEAKLLNCDLILNDNVQHKNETWFNGPREDCYKYMNERVDKFWEFYE